LFATSGVRGADLGTITTFDVPGATNTIPLDINADGTIVGRCLIAGRVHGFVRSQSGDLGMIDVPGATMTVAAAINDRGDIVGQYAVPGAPMRRHGFLLVAGQFTTFDPPGSTFTNALGINERDDIVGRYCTFTPCAVGTGVAHGFLLRDGAFTMIDVPGAKETDAFGINGSEDIAGGFLTAGHQEQIFVLINGEYAAMAPPGGQNVSLDKGGINERGEVVGLYCDVVFPCAIVPTGTHGFLYNSDGFTTIDIPGASATAAVGINARGDIVGSYFDVFGGHGFLLTRSE